MKLWPPGNPVKIETHSTSSKKTLKHSNHMIGFYRLAARNLTGDLIHQINCTEEVVVVGI